jgi:sugar lactone lactonase YvrE
MSRPRDPDARLAAWLEEGPTSGPDDGLSNVHARARSTRQRPDWLVTLKGGTMETTWRARPVLTARVAFVLLIALLALALTAGTVIVGGQLLRPTGPSDRLPAAVVLPPTACPAGTQLHSGDIATVAGTGTLIASGVDGGQATAAAIAAPYATIAVDASGALYVSEATGRAIRRIGTDGIISHFISSPDFVPASFPMGLAFDAVGDLIVADPGSLSTPFIWKVDAAGAVTPVAGTGISGSTGNDGPALSAEIQAAQVAIGPRGDLYFDDNNNFRTVDTAGMIHAFAGTGAPGFSGDGGRAVDATFGVSEPVWMGVAADAAGNVYLGDPSNYRIRKVDAAGMITTIAGTGVAGYSGDNGPAVEATISSIGGLAVDPAGNVFVADTGNNVVRKIDPSGAITTVAGTGQSGAFGDCGPAVQAQLSQPSTVATHDGILYIVDVGNNRVRMVVP